MAGVIIREARSDELGAVAALMREAYRPFVQAFPSEAQEAATGYMADIGNVWSRLGISELLVAENGGRLAGAVTFFADGRRAEAGGWPAGWSGFRLLAVAAEHRGRGIGRALAEECIRRSAELGSKAVGLHTTEGMAIARGMYERMGFRRVPDYDFQAGPGTLVMGYRLDL